MKKPNYRTAIRWAALVLFHFLVTITPLSAQTSCNCTEYLYLNDVGTGEVHKFSVDPATGDLTEIGAPWMSGFDSPHGLGTDLNGFLYIGNDPTNGPVYRVDCGGGTRDTDGEIWNTSIQGGGLTNIGSVDNFVLVNGANMSMGFDSIYVLDACTGDVLGGICLQGNPGVDWGLQVLPDGRVLATHGLRFNGITLDRIIWTFEFSEDLIGQCVDPLVSSAQPAGSYFAPYEELYGITTDGTFLYVIARDGGNATSLLKIDATTGALVQAQAEGGLDGSGYSGARGLIYSPAADLLYVAGLEECISIVDPSNLQYLRPGNNTPVDPNSIPKAIGINTECCPVVTPVALDTAICLGGGAETFFLQRLVNCGAGTICEGMWQEATATDNLNFETCNNSIDVVGPGCGTYTLSSDGTGANAQCGAFSITVDVSFYEEPSVDLAVECQYDPDTGESEFFLNGTATAAPCLSSSFNLLRSGTVIATESADAGTGIATFSNVPLGSVPAEDEVFEIRYVEIPTCEPVQVVLSLTACEPECPTTNCAGVLVNGMAQEGYDEMPCPDAVFTVCSDGSNNIELSADAGLTNVQWFNEAGPIAGATGTTFTVDGSTEGLADGSESFYYTATDAAGCPTELCCPVQVATEQCASLTLGSTVFEDADNNGEQDNGETGIGGVLVVLYAEGGDGQTDGADDTALVTGADGIPGTADDAFGPDGISGTADDGQPGVLTDAEGNYFFADLMPGDYYVQIPADAFAADAPLENLPISSNTSSGTFAGETDPDDNADGDDDGLQTGTGTATTSQIISLAVGEEPTDLTTENAQGNLQDNPANGYVDEDGNMTLDFGFFAPVSLGDFTFVDLDGDGLRDTDEPVLPQVTVTIFNADGTPVTTDAEGNVYDNETTTDANGMYQFSGLPPGDYYVVFDLSTAPGSDFYDFTTNTGGDDNIDSDADPSTGQTDNSGFIPSGDQITTLDAGVVCILTVEAGTGTTICSTDSIDLTTLGASITPADVAGFGGTWTTMTDGTFDDGAGRFGEATVYRPGAEDIAAGSVTLTLRSDDPSQAPFDAAACGPVSDVVTIIIQNVDCGSFPWPGGQ